MPHGIYKETYRGRAIYYYPHARMYGDETLPLYCTHAEARSAIDARIAQQAAARSAHERYWDGLAPREREHWRRQAASSDLSAPELAYAHRACTGES